MNRPEDVENAGVRRDTPSSLVFYNDNDTFATAWLRNLIAVGELPPGDVDGRSIVDVRPGDVAGYIQCHWFSGIGGWPLALKLAGWEGPVWTGSCPCQPLSVAGQRLGHADSRHVWPAFYALIAECRPATIFGEQVASKDGREWLAGIRADLEHLGYAVGCADLPAASVGAPHIRQRLFWVADANQYGSQRENIANYRRPGTDGCGANGSMADADGWHASNGDLQRSRQQRQQSQNGSATGGVAESASDGAVGSHSNAGSGVERDRSPGNGQYARSDSASCGLADAPREQLNGRGHQGGRRREPSDGSGLDNAASEQVGRAGQPWQDSAWLPCADGKARRIEPSAFPLAHGVPARVGRLRAYGNAIVPALAAEFVSAWMETKE